MSIEAQKIGNISTYSPMDGLCQQTCSNKLTDR